MFLFHIPQGQAGQKQQDSEGRGARYQGCLGQGSACSLSQFCAPVMRWAALGPGVHLAAPSVHSPICFWQRSFSRILPGTGWEKVKTSVGALLPPLGAWRCNNKLHPLVLCPLLSWPSFSDVVVTYSGSSFKNNTQIYSRTEKAAE